jgi:hypothetical protein
LHRWSVLLDFALHLAEFSLNFLKLGRGKLSFIDKKKITVKSSSENERTLHLDRKHGVPSGLTDEQVAIIELSTGKKLNTLLYK